MLVKKAFKFRLYPNQKQIEMIEKTFGCSRFVANFVIAQQKKKDAIWYTVNEMFQQGFLIGNNYKGTLFNKIEAIKDVTQLKKHYTWLKEVDSLALQTSVENVADTYFRYYKKQGNKPKFKSKKNPVQSYTTRNVNENIKVLESHIKLPKLGLVRFAKSKVVNGAIKRATIRKTPSGKFYISLLAEVEIQKLPKTKSNVGIDLGLSKLITLSSGVYYDNPKFFRTLEKKLVEAQRKLSRRKTGGANWNKQRIKVARIHERIVNCRTDYLQKISTDIVKNHDVIGVENLKVNNMKQNRRLSKAISEVSWYQFRVMLEYKANWYGKELVLVNPKYTSQRCNRCEHTDKKNRVSQSEFLCQLCGYTDNADVNAAKNIEELALAN